MNQQRPSPEMHLSARLPSHPKADQKTTHPKVLEVVVRRIGSPAGSTAPPKTNLRRYARTSGPNAGCNPADSDNKIPGRASVRLRDPTNRKDTWKLIPSLARKARLWRAAAASDRPTDDPCLLVAILPGPSTPGMASKRHKEMRLFNTSVHAFGSRVKSSFHGSQVSSIRFWQVRRSRWHIPLLLHLQ